MSVILKKLQHAANDMRSWPKRSGVANRAVTFIGPSSGHSNLFRGAVLLLLLATTIMSFLAWRNSLEPKADPVAAKTNLMKASVPAAKIIVKVEHEARREPKVAEKLPAPRDLPPPPPRATTTAYEDIVLPAETLRADDKNVAPTPDSAPTIAVVAEKITETPVLQPAKADDKAARKDGVTLHVSDDADTADIEGDMIAWGKSGKTEQAIDAGHLLIKAQPQNPEVRKRLTTALSESAMPASMAELEKQVGDDPVDAAAQAGYARLLARRGYFEKAYDHLNKAIKLAPENIAYRLDLAILYDRAGYQRDALTLYNQALHAVMQIDDPTQLALPLDSIKQRVGYLQNSFAAERD